MSGEDSEKAPPCQNCGTPRRADGLAFCANCGLPYPDWTNPSTALRLPQRRPVWERLALVILFLIPVSGLAYIGRGYYLVTLDPVETQAVVTSVITGVIGGGSFEYQYSGEGRDCTGDARHDGRNVPRVGAAIRVYYARADPCISSYPGVRSAFDDILFKSLFMLGLLIVGLGRAAFDRIRRRPVR